MREGNTVQSVGKAECEIVDTTITTTLKKGGETVQRKSPEDGKKKSNACGLVNRSMWDIIFLVYFPMLSSFIE